MLLITVESITAGVTGVVSALYKWMQLKVMLNLLSKCCTPKIKPNSDKDRANSKAVEIWHLVKQFLDLSIIKPHRPAIMVANSYMGKCVLAKAIRSQMMLVCRWHTALHTQCNTNVYLVLPHETDTNIYRPVLQ